MKHRTTAVSTSWLQRSLADLGATGSLARREPVGTMRAKTRTRTHLRASALPSPSCRPTTPCSTSRSRRSPSTPSSRRTSNPCDAVPRQAAKRPARSGDSLGQDPVDSPRFAAGEHRQQPIPVHTSSLRRREPTALGDRLGADRWGRQRVSPDPGGTRRWRAARVQRRQRSKDQGRRREDTRRNPT